MTQKVKTIIWVAVFAIVLISAVLLYNGLSDEMKSAELPQTNEQEQPAANEAEAETNVETETKATDDEAEIATGEDENPQVPSFTVLDANSKEVKLSDMFGKPIVLNFWASWCPPCKAEMPEFETLYKELGGDVVFMMVNLTDGQRETLDTAKAFIEDEGYTFPIYFDTEQEAAYTYGVYSIPMSLFIDKDGVLADAVIGSIDEKYLRNSIAKIYNAAG